LINPQEILEKVPDTPPVPGYTSANRNSLLDWKNKKEDARDADDVMRALPNSSNVQMFNARTTQI